MERLKKRADFLRLAKSKAVRMPAFVLQFQDSESLKPRIGYTVTKRQGNAIIRNRIRRRLREAVRHVDKAAPFPCADYVVIGRKESLSFSFADLQAQLQRARDKASQLLPSELLPERS